MGRRRGGWVGQLWVRQSGPRLTLPGHQASGRSAGWAACRRSAISINGLSAQQVVLRVDRKHRR